MRYSGKSYLWLKASSYNRQSFSAPRLTGCKVALYSRQPAAYITRHQDVPLPHPVRFNPLPVRLARTANPLAPFSPIKQKKQAALNRQRFSASSSPPAHKSVPDRFLSTRLAGYYTCIFIMSWYAATSLLRTWTPICSEMDDFCRSTITSFSATPGVPIANFSA